VSEKNIIYRRSPHAIHKPKAKVREANIDVVAAPFRPVPTSGRDPVGKVSSFIYGELKTNR
jgi:hypothetical protein